MNTALLIQLSLSSLIAHRAKAALAGTVLAFGGWLFVMGIALLDSIERAAAESITASITGHIQVYSDAASDKLSFFGGTTVGIPDLGRIRDYGPLKALIEEVPGVDAVMPMGIGIASVTSGSELERALARARELARAHADDEPRLRRELSALWTRIDEVLRKLDEEAERTGQLSADQDQVQRLRAAIAAVRTPAFAQRFLDDPLAALEHLDTEVAPLGGDGRNLFFRYLGVDSDRFPRVFKRFTVLSGEPIPPGGRGFMLNQRIYDRMVKNKTARDLDTLLRAVVEDGRTIAGDSELTDLVKRMARQPQHVLFQLTGSDAAEVEAELRKLLPNHTGGLSELFQEFLTVNDATLRQRHAAFYRIVAPKIRLYDMAVGETVTVRAMTQSGYIRAVNAKLWGTFRFEGLERSDFAGVYHISDMATWRELFGLMSEETRAELLAAKAQLGVRDVSREEAEAALFGGEDDESPPGTSLGEAAKGTAPGEPAAERQSAEAPGADAGTAAGGGPSDERLSQTLAVVLKPGVSVRATIAEIQRRLAARPDIPPMRLADWREAAGIVGQTATVLWGVLALALGIILAASVLIINNAMLIAATERTVEIGTLRAIGAGRTFVQVMFLLETAALGIVAGGIGVGLGVASIGGLGVWGIPAPSEILMFLFSGPRLYPTVSASQVAVAWFAAVAVGVFSAWMPARYAASVAPITAMAARE